MIIGIIWVLVILFTKKRLYDADVMVLATAAIFEIFLFDLIIILKLLN